MATGILSLAAHSQQLTGLAEGLFYFNLVAFPVLVLLLVLRLALHSKALWQELTSHAKGANFLTLVPATCLVGNQFVQLRHNPLVGSMLWVGAAVLWLLLTYAFLFGISIGEEKPALEKGFNEGWLLLVVATESLVVLGTKLVPTWAVAPSNSLFALMSLFLLGCVLYILLSTVLFYRLAFVKLAGEDIGATYWISTGASAIAALAGISLAGSLGQAPELSSMVPFVKGLSVLFWAVSTWWLPLVAGLRLYNHLTTRPAFVYAPAYWGMVFPLGMYTVATGRLADGLPLPALASIPSYFIYVALAAWLLTLLGMLYHAATATKPQPASAS